tara:strand:- start:18 stop:725 length:708 start_codon:yes stop_codon:yes gene_type:complete
MELYNNDCIEQMKELPDGRVDLIISDLPYKRLNKKWDIPINLADMWQQIWRVLIPNGAVCLFADMKFAVELINSCPKHYKYEIAWHKTKSTNPFMNCKRHGTSMEYILVFCKGNIRYNLSEHNVETETDGTEFKYESLTNAREKFKRRTFSPRLPLNFIKCNSVTKSAIAGITEKPQDVLKHLINYFSYPHETILDFCIGSGSTGIACKNLNRKFIGIELNKEHFNIAKKRLNNE